MELEEINGGFIGLMVEWREHVWLHRDFERKKNLLSKFEYCDAVINNEAALGVKMIKTMVLLKEEWKTFNIMVDFLESRWITVILQKYYFDSVSHM
jgi:hypothetical protein